mgnify:CR=1 FL=1|tara:strand:- start:306 stop:1370 length:1065 start_codon:yes stop_codon:yes gene_type:complete
MGVSREKGNVPNIVNTPTGPREREDQPKQPRYIPRLPSPTGCPDPSMTILMADGSYKKAGKLVVGDLIKTYHEKDLEKASKKSLVLASGEAEKYSEIRDKLESSYAIPTLGEYEVEFIDIIKDVEKIKLTFDGSEIICSLSHKFYVNDTWKEAKDLEVNEEVSGKKLISKEDVDNGDVVFITIKDAHTYICEGLLSHNKKRIERPEDREKRLERQEEMKKKRQERIDTYNQSGDSFGRRRDRRMAGDRTGFFGRVPKRPGEGFLGTRLPMPIGRPTRGDRPGGFPTRRPAPDTRDRVPKPPSGGRGFGISISMSPNATPEQRKAAFDKLVAERGPMRPFPRRRNQDQNIAKTDV